MNLALGPLRRIKPLPGERFESGLLNIFEHGQRPFECSPMHPCPGNL
jgi:hypothetical protein